MKYASYETLNNPYSYITVSGIVEILTKLSIKAKYYPIKPIGVQKATKNMLEAVKQGKLYFNSV